ncbi:MAG: N-acetylglucosamine-6-phosphate deacetylase [Verrucomicrobia subdivision 3 bacterium]|nr:N-acetylglucosamine-6-phosphate deacetylase [Limisphaerales bacterium]
MNSGELIAWHYALEEPVRLRWLDGRIIRMDSAPHFPPRTLWVAPPLVDLQVNGYAGVDFQSDDVSFDDLAAAVAGLHAAGCGRFFLTLISDEWPRMIARLRRLRELRRKSGLLIQAIAGWHIEGPFLSAEPGFRGAHPPEVMRDPTADHLKELRLAAGDERLMITVAPERLEAVAIIGQARELGIIVSLGHTNAPRKRLLQAQKAGATAFTHLGNGCPRELDRAENILWRVFETPGLKVSLIPDAIHVSPPLFRLIHRTLPDGSIFYVTDAMAAAGAAPGRYRLGRLELEVGPDEIVRLPGSGNFAGSALRPIDGVFRAAEMLRCSWREVWSRFSHVPAEVAGVSCSLALGSRADFCVLEVTEENVLDDLSLYIGGERIAAAV